MPDGEARTHAVTPLLESATDRLHASRTAWRRQLENEAVLKLTVDRSNLLGALGEFGQRLSSVRMNFSVAFSDDVAHDAGGLRREFLMVAVDEALRTAFEDDGRGVLLPRADADPAVMTGVGAAVCKAVHDGFHLSSVHRWPLALLRFLQLSATSSQLSAPRMMASAEAWFASPGSTRFRASLSTEDLAEFAGAEVVARVESVRTASAAELEAYMLELPSGEALCAANRTQFITWEVFRQLFASRWSAVTALWRGFHNTATSEMRQVLESLSPSELRVVLGGAPLEAVCMADLIRMRGSVVVFGNLVAQFPAASERRLRAVLDSLDTKETRMLLRFATGCDAVPFRPSEAFLRFTYETSLPANGLFHSRTCANTVHVPPFGSHMSEAAIRDILIKSIEWGADGFGLR